MRFTSAVSALGLVVLLATSSLAQLSDFGLGGGGAAAGKDPNYSAKLFVVEGSKEGVLEFELQLPEGFKTYDVSEPPGGIGIPATMKLPDPKKTKVPNGLDFAGPWVPDHEPKMVEEEGEDHPVHYGTVIWKARVKFEDGVDPKKLKLKLKHNGQMCAEGVCQPIGKEVEVKFAGAMKKEDADGLPLFKKAAKAESNGKPSYSARLFVVEGARDGVIEFELQLPEGYNTYAMLTPKRNEWLPSKVTLPNLAKTGKSNGFELVGPWTSNEEPKVVTKNGKQFPEHFGSVIWRAPIELNEGVSAKELSVNVFYSGQMCTDQTCEQIESTVEAKYLGSIDKLVVAKLPRSNDVAARKAAPATTVSEIEPNESIAATPVLKARTEVLENLDPQDINGKRQPYSFGAIVLFALAGGFILNFMPCVLPVIGLKIASFAEQAGESSGRVIALNLFYSLGLLSVFMVLATLTAFWSFGWGQQNQSLVFNIVMASVVFAMGLSMIGVWEIPIPGLAMSTGANKLSQKEGPQGAFFKGVLTTILAVPCSGPGLATALLYCQNKPPQVTYVVFFCLALGMAAPYLILGAFPSMVRFLPKPGAWMETFKQLMGFVLMGTVVYLMSYIPFDYLLSTVALLFGIWMACWYFGRVPAWESASKRLTAAVTGAGIIGCVCIISFFWLNHVMHERVEWNALRIADEVNAKLKSGELAATNKLPWKAYSIEKLGQLTSEKKTVMVDFTADWCPTCKVLEKTVLNTAAAKEVVEQNKVETLLADWTTVDSDVEDEIGETLLKLGSSKQIPVLAIFPADNPKKPIVLMGAYTQQTLVDALRKAGPSKPVGTTVKSKESNAKGATTFAASSSKSDKG